MGDGTQHTRVQQCDYVICTWEFPVARVFKAGAGQRERNSDNFCSIYPFAIHSIEDYWRNGCDRVHSLSSIQRRNSYINATFFFLYSDNECFVDGCWTSGKVKGNLDQIGYRIVLELLFHISLNRKAFGFWRESVRISYINLFNHSVPLSI